MCNNYLPRDNVVHVTPQYCTTRGTNTCINKTGEVYIENRYLDEIVPRWIEPKAVDEAEPDDSTNPKDLMEDKYSDERIQWWIEQKAKDDVKVSDLTNPKDLIGAKKPRLSLVPSTATIQLALAMQNGADKYGAYNWRDKKVQTMIYLDACQRHVLSYLDGEEAAEDSGIKHLAHAMACLAIILDAEENGCLIDNRPKKGKAAELLKRHTKHDKT